MSAEKGRDGGEQGEGWRRTRGGMAAEVGGRSPPACIGSIYHCLAAHVRAARPFGCAIARCAWLYNIAPLRPARPSAHPPLYNPDGQTRRQAAQWELHLTLNGHKLMRDPIAPSSELLRLPCPHPSCCGGCPVSRWRVRILHSIEIYK